MPGGMRALRAELRGRRELPAAVRARASQRRRALLAELRAGRVLVLAPRALHRPGLPSAGPSLHCRADSWTERTRRPSSGPKDRPAGEHLVCRTTAFSRSLRRLSPPLVAKPRETDDGHAGGSSRAHARLILMAQDSAQANLGAESSIAEEEDRRCPPAPSKATSVATPRICFVALSSFTAR